MIQQNFRKLGCSECAAGAGLSFDFTMAFQPIVNIATGDTFAHEALVRGPNNESSGDVFKNVNVSNRYQFDQVCRVKAVELASQLHMSSLLSINFMPNAVYRPELCIRTTLEAAEKYDFPANRIIFEITEGEQVTDHGHLREIVAHYKQRGFLTALDDFGAGYSGLNLLAEIQTDLLKLDMGLVRNINQDRSRRSIVKAVVQLCDDLSIRVIGEGVETYEELSVLRDLGIELIQGYYFAKPTFQELAIVPPALLERNQA